MVKKKTNKKKVNNAQHIKKLYRSKEDKLIAGVCGGISEYFMIDPIWVRLAFIVGALIDGIGIVAYIIIWILVPENPTHRSNKQTVVEEKVQKVGATLRKDYKDGKINKARNGTGHFYIGMILILLGALFLIKNVFGWFDSDVFWPLLIIVIGITLIYRNLK